MSSKHLLFTLSTLLSTIVMSGLKAQQQDTLYFDFSLQKTTKGNQMFYGFESKENSNTVLTMYYATGKIRLKGPISMDQVSSPTLTNHYYPTGVIKQIDYYSPHRLDSIYFYNESGEFTNKEYPEPQEKINDSLIYQIVDEDPTFPGGNEAYQRFLNQQLRYPPEALKNGIQGTVYIRFIVRNNGELTNIEVQKSPDISLSKVGLDLISNMPNWIPAKYKGKNVSAEVVIPIRFSF